MISEAIELQPGHRLEITAHQGSQILISVHDSSPRPTHPMQFFPDAKTNLRLFIKANFDKFNFLQSGKVEDQDNFDMETGKSLEEVIRELRRSNIPRVMVRDEVINILKRMGLPLAEIEDLTAIIVKQITNTAQSIQ